jgi:hypothetical protein
MITSFTCTCGANHPSDAKYYDGLLGYEALVCKKCGRYYDHGGEHPADEWSKSFAGLPDDDDQQKVNILYGTKPHFMNIAERAINLGDAIPRALEEQRILFQKHLEVIENVSDPRDKAAIKSSFADLCTGQLKITEIIGQFFKS